MSDALGLLTPAVLWSLLFALAAGLIHLLSRSKIQRMPFPHLPLIPTAKLTPAWQWVLQQRRLLLLRWLLIALLALLLSQCFWSERQTPVDDEVTQLLISKDWLQHADAQQKQALAQALNNRNGWLLDHQLTALTKNQIINYPAAATPYVANLWATLAEHSHRFEPDTPLQVYVSDRAAQFVGGVAAVPQPLSWKVLTTPAVADSRSPALQVDVIVPASGANELPNWRFGFELVQTVLPTLTVNYHREVDQAALQHSDWLLNLSATEVKTQAARLESLSPQLHTADFALQLAKTLLAGQANYAQIQSYRVTEAQLINASSRAPAPLARQTDLTPSTPPLWLIISIVMVFVLERWFSERNRVTPGMVD